MVSGSTDITSGPGEIKPNDEALYHYENKINGTLPRDIKIDYFVRKGNETERWDNVFSIVGDWNDSGTVTVDTSGMEVGEKITVRIRMYERSGAWPSWNKVDSDTVETEIVEESSDGGDGSATSPADIEEFFRELREWVNALGMLISGAVAGLATWWLTGDIKLTGVAVIVGILVGTIGYGTYVAGYETVSLILYGLAAVVATGVAMYWTDIIQGLRTATDVAADTARTAASIKTGGIL